MADEYNVFPVPTGESTERTECDAMNDDQQILRLNILHKLIEFLKDPNQKYVLLSVLRLVQEEYEEKVFCRELSALVQEGYIETRPTEEAKNNATETDDTDIVKRLLEEGNYDNILIALKEQQSGLLLHNFVDVNIAMFELKLQFKNVVEEFEQQKDIIEEYGKKQQDISKINTKFQQKYRAFKKSRGKWDKKQKDVEKAVVSNAEKKVEETIEEEIKSTGRIGQALQDAQKNIIQYLAIFVAIFSLVNINVVNAVKWSYAELFRVNVIMTTSMATLVTLVHIFTDEEHKWFRPMIILLAVLWIALAVSSCSIR